MLDFFIAFAVKLLIIPLHTWLPDAHGEAHYNTCMLLARILLKMGMYGLVRINMELSPHGIITSRTFYIFLTSSSLKLERPSKSDKHDNIPQSKS